MVDYHELMTLLSVPRPNGSVAERETARALKDWLNRHRIKFRSQNFRLYPYFFECVGLWLIISRTLLAVAIWERWGWVTFPTALIGLLGGLLDTALNIPLVTWPGAQQGENILIDFDPPLAKREVIFSAHYDTKTELLDHQQRMLLYKNLNIGILLTLLMGVWGPLDIWLMNSTIYWIGVLLTTPMLLLAWGLGLHLSLGRRLRPSQGALDNGAACAILLGLAERLSKSESSLSDTKMTLALFTGEEVNMQGSRAYVKSREWHLPTEVINLEIMGQNGGYIFWEEDGNVFRLLPTTHHLNEMYSIAVKRVTGTPAQPAGPVNSDAASFLFAGIPATTIGTIDTHMGATGFHRPTDNMDRVVIERLPEGVEILSAFLKTFNQSNGDDHGN